MPVVRLVDCRIGSLEIVYAVHAVEYQVDCRIGSLENANILTTMRQVVDCRIGSLEMMDSVNLST